MLKQNHEIFANLSFNKKLNPFLFLFLEGDNDSGVDETTQGNVSIEYIHSRK